MKKILYLTYDGLTDTLGQSQVLPYLLGLSRQGFEITIISTEKKNTYAQRVSTISQIIEHNNKHSKAPISWQPIFYTKKPPVFSTLWDIWQLQKQALALHKKHNFDLMHCRSYITALIGLSLHKRLKVPYLFDMRGFWADERIDGGLWNLKNPIYRKIYRYFKQKEREFLQTAAYTISLTENAKQEIEQWQLPKLSPIKVIPCCADLDLFTIPQEKKSREIQKITISYLGSLGTWYMLEEMLDFFKQLLVTYPTAEFLFITPDSADFILNMAKSKQIDTSQIRVQKAERKEVPYFLAQSHISLFFIKPAYSKKASSPTKMAEILGVGIPMIVNAGVGDNDFLFQNYTCGAVVNDFKESDYQEVINKIPTLLAIPASALRQTALSYFSLEEGIKRYTQVYESVLGKY